jgi:hypothetical protein
MNATAPASSSASRPHRRGRGSRRRASTVMTDAASVTAARSFRISQGTGRPPTSGPVRRPGARRPVGRGAAEPRGGCPAVRRRLPVSRCCPDGSERGSEPGQDGQVACSLTRKLCRTRGAASPLGRGSSELPLDRATLVIDAPPTVGPARDHRVQPVRDDKPARSLALAGETRGDARRPAAACSWASNASAGSARSSSGRWSGPRPRSSRTSWC